MNRRMFLGAIMGSSVAYSLNAYSKQASPGADQSWKNTRGVFYVGAMPWIRLFEDNRLTCWASVALADYSPHGEGRVVVVRTGGRRRTVGDNELLASWLEDWLESSSVESKEYKRYPFEKSNVDVDLNLNTGLHVRASDISVEMTGVISRQHIYREKYQLGDFSPTASWVRIPCARAHIEVDGKPIAGTPKLSSDSVGPSSTAQINVAEVWTT